MNAAQVMAQASAEFQAARAKARRWPPVGVRKSTGRKRDHAEAKARRQYILALRGVSRAAAMRAA